MAWFTGTFGLSLAWLSDFIGMSGFWVLACSEATGFIVAMFCGQF